tara:strand:+ start:7022 stop:7195 length:174 start_codon:yes stop_codon:yes gene_type:complete
MMSEIFVTFFVSFYLFFGVLCVIVGFKKIAEGKRRQEKKILKDSFKLIKGSKDASND